MTISGDLFFLVLILCCLFGCGGVFRRCVDNHAIDSGPAGGGSSFARDADGLQDRIEVLERIVTDRKAALREKISGLE